MSKFLTDTLAKIVTNILHIFPFHNILHRFSFSEKKTPILVPAKGSPPHVYGLVRNLLFLPSLESYSYSCMSQHLSPGQLLQIPPIPPWMPPG